MSDRRQRLGRNRRPPRIRVFSVVPDFIGTGKCGGQLVVAVVSDLICIDVRMIGGPKAVSVLVVVVIASTVLVDAVVPDFSGVDGEISSSRSLQSSPTSPSRSVCASDR